MSTGAQLASIVFSVAVFCIVFEMVRRRRLQERYALLWLAASLVLVLLAVWAQLLDSVASLVGIATPANAFFVIAFAFLLLLLLHMTAVASQLSDETRVLAQRLAIVEQRLRERQDVDQLESTAREPPRVDPAMAEFDRPRAPTRS
jgi:hypothetical protein